MGENSNKKDFSNGRIYCIRNSIDNDIYVGSTTQSLSRRMGEHRSEHKRGRLKSTLLREKMDELGIDKFYIELIEECKCDNIEQLRAREGMYIREMGTLNKRIEDRGRKEYWEQYYQNEKKEETTICKTLQRDQPRQDTGE